MTKKKHSLLRKRFSLQSFFGLPLTLITAVIIFNLILITDLTAQIIYSHSFETIDQNVATFMSSIRTETGAAFFYTITLSCNLEVVVTIAFITAISLLFKKKYIYIFSIITTLIGSGLTIWLGKNYFKITRPSNLAFYAEDSYSFPSGHTTIAIAFYGMLLYLMSKKEHHLFNTSTQITLTLTFALLIGFSRLYLGVHHLSDVIVGFLLGLLWLLLSISIIKWKELIYNPIQK